MGQVSSQCTPRMVLFLAALLYCSCALAWPSGPDCYIQTAHDMTHFDKCIIAGAHGRARLATRLINRVSFDQYGLGEVVAGGFYYVNRRGAMVLALTYDNGPDYFSEGLARIPVDGKIGFIDRRLSTVISPAYDWADPFENGFAIVCDGCVEVPVGEHSVTKGGKWGAIDKSGRVALPLRYSGYEQVDAEIHTLGRGSR